MKTGISLICMGAGNIKVLRETFKSASTVCDEIVYGDMLLFEEDRKILHSYQEEFNLKIIELPFNYIFAYGFASVLNYLAAKTSNDLVLYLNTSEVIEKNNGILSIINPEYNCYYFDHATDPHRWFRFYNKRELVWSGYIHEALEALPGCDFKPYHKATFRMADLEKDMDNTFKATVFNDCKELVYFFNYCKLVELPESMLGATDPGWFKFAEDNYNSMLERMHKKGNRFNAFRQGSLEMYLKDIMTNPEFEKLRFESNIGIEYQGDKRYLL